MAQSIIETLSADDACIGAQGRVSQTEAALTVAPLRAADEHEVLEFLKARPLHTVIMAGLMRDNGLESHFNRGQFLGCRNRRHKLVGVALIGYITQIETHDESVRAALSECVRGCSCVNMIIGETEKLAGLRAYFMQTDQVARVVEHELLAVPRQPLEVYAPIKGLRQATAADLELVAAAHDELAQIESGISPLEVDPEGFRLRTARRVAQGRVWVWIESGRLIFKADVVSDTPQANYLEGIYVSAAERGRGLGLRCLSQLSRRLLLNTEALCLLVDRQNQRARAFYRRVGFKLHSQYETIFLATCDTGESQRVK
jgi:uncharacterized protein